MADKKRDDAEVEGEGSYTATKQYAASQEKFSKTHDAQKLGEEAERDLEENPDEFAKAEAEGKSHAKT